MTYQMVATAVTLNDLEGHSPLADVFKCNPSNICAAFYTISTDRVLAWFLCISRASCYYRASFFAFCVLLLVDLSLVICIPVKSIAQKGYLRNDLLCHLRVELGAWPPWPTVSARDVVETCSIMVHLIKSVVITVSIRSVALEKYHLVS